nr:Chain Y, Synthetic peptide 2 [synthetic construct]
VEVPLAGAV